MNEETNNKAGNKNLTPRIRVLAGFGAIADEVPTIDIAMTLAQALEADIAGCFVEDVDLLNLAALPFAKAVRPADQSVLEIEHDQMKEQISRAASTCENQLIARASGASVRCSFKTMRGGYSAEIARETATSDIVVMNPVNLPHRRHDAVSLLVDGVRKAKGTVVLPARYRRSTGGPVVLVTTGSDGERTGFELADRIARGMDKKTIILSGGDEHADLSRVRAMAQEVFGSRVDFRSIRGNHMPAVAAALADLRPSFVVLQPLARSLTDAIIESLLNAGRAPLMLMRRIG